MLLQHRGKCRLILAQLVSREVMHSAECRISSRKNGCVRGKCYRNGSVCALEPDPARSQHVDVRGMDSPVSITGEVICSQGIDRDENNVWGWDGFCRTAAGNQPAQPAKCYQTTAQKHELAALYPRPRCARPAEKVVQAYANLTANEGSVSARSRSGDGGRVFRCGGKSFA